MIDESKRTKKNQENKKDQMKDECFKYKNNEWKKEQIKKKSLQYKQNNEQKKEEIKERIKQKLSLLCKKINNV